MSLELMKLAWSCKRLTVPSHKLVLLRLCDESRDGANGWCCLGLKRIFSECCIGERNAQYILEHLEKEGYIRREFGSGMKHTNRYQIIVETLADEFHVAREDATQFTGASGCTVQPDAAKGEADCAGTVQPDAPPGEAGCTQSQRDPKESQKEPTPSARAPWAGVVKIRSGQKTDSLDFSDDPETPGSRSHQRLVLMLDRLAVASGPKALPRWLVQARRNSHARSFEDLLGVIAYAVERARSEDGIVVNFASDVHRYVRAWRPKQRAEGVA